MEQKHFSAKNSHDPDIFLLFFLTQPVGNNNLICSHLHQSTEHINSSMCDSIIIPFQSFYNLHSKLVSEPVTH